MEPDPAAFQLDPLKPFLLACYTATFGDGFAPSVKEIILSEQVQEVNTSFAMLTSVKGESESVLAKGGAGKDPSRASINALADGCAPAA